MTPPVASPDGVLGWSPPDMTVHLRLDGSAPVRIGGIRSANGQDTTAGAGVPLVELGCELTVLRRVVLPLCGPLIGLLVILTFVWRSNDFIWPLVALQGQENFTLPLGLDSMHGTYRSPIEAVMAVSVISMIPVMVIFVLLQRRFVQGIASTGLR